MRGTMESARRRGSIHLEIGQAGRRSQERDRLRHGHPTTARCNYRRARALNSERGFALQCAEVPLAMGGEDGRDRPPGVANHILIQIDERAVENSRESRADGGLARPRQPDKHDMRTQGQRDAQRESATRNSRRSRRVEWLGCVGRHVARRQRGRPNRTSARPPGPGTRRNSVVVHPESRRRTSREMPAP